VETVCQLSTNKAPSIFLQIMGTMNSQVISRLAVRTI
jgi:hypothetical protein